MAPADAERIRWAAEAARDSVGAFVVDAARAKADEVLARGNETVVPGRRYRPHCSSAFAGFDAAGRWNATSLGSALEGLLREAQKLPDPPMLQTSFSRPGGEMSRILRGAT